MVNFVSSSGVAPSPQLIQGASVAQAAHLTVAQHPVLAADASQAPSHSTKVAAAGLVGASVLAASSKRSRRNAKKTAARKAAQVNYFDGSAQTFGPPAEDPNAPYSAEKVVGEKDACGVGMIVNVEKPANHEILANTLNALSCMEHRGACSSGMDSTISRCGGDDSGDGAGIMTQIPWELFGQCVALPDDLSHVAVGCLFLSKDPLDRVETKRALETGLIEEGFQIIGYRVVPVDSSILGKASATSEPFVEQIFVYHPKFYGDCLEAPLYIARRKVEKKMSYDSLYVASFSTRTIVYKGMLKSVHLAMYYKDLQNPDYKVQYALWHRRFSTNTMPRWPLAQPFRTIGHNGEINTIQGNYNWAQARSSAFEHQNFGYRMEEVLPPCRAENSDSGNLDNYCEMMLRCNREIPEALMMMVPEAYAGAYEDDSPVKNFYEYWGALQEPWDGPALIAYCDGKYMGAKLDRNGLRPARYFRLNDGTTVVSSEVGIMKEEAAPPESFVSKGRLGPGQMVAIDLSTGELIEDSEIKTKMSVKNPYDDWNKVFREDLGFIDFLAVEHDLKQAKHVEDDLLRMEFDQGYTIEDVEMVVESMALTGKEPTFCMGNDKPLAILSDRPHVMYDYFQQRFAQVTNPAIDPYREALVMSVEVYLGRQGNLMAERPTYFENLATNNRLLKIDSPFMHEAQLEKITTKTGLLTVELTTRYNFSEGPAGLEKALSDLCYEASNAVRNGAELVVLSDMPNAKSTGELERDQLAIPPLLAVGAVHHYLIMNGCRTQVSLIVNTAQCWSTHHFAMLIGYGASAVCPYLALAHIRKFYATTKGKAKADGQTVQQCQDNFKKSIVGGLKKIMSKMGISVLESYREAQIFQCIGLSDKVIDICFAGTPATLGGLTLAEIANESMMFHRRAFPELEETKVDEKLQFAGWYKYRKNGGEFHMNNPDMSKALHKAVRQNDPMSYEEYRRQIMDGRPITAIRDMLDFASDRQPIPLADVEDALSITSRFVTGGMSLGALSQEAHEVIALGMNRVGGKSNSGEGGEDKNRYKTITDADEEGHSKQFPALNGLRNGDSANSGTKQLASGRFGVTPEYLVNAKQLEIKLAQGAKPGEGGQLPGPKVNAYIASLRNSTPGVELISPPPHHDIYSIEDLAQLIYDLHHICPEAKVSVKLVASAGIGTIAAGVAKANADVIQISGCDGGTGASPLSSIMHAGGPWEQGLAEVQGVLTTNNLRNQVCLRIDGGLKSGWDIVMAAMSGGEEFGFGSIVMIAEGCIMARVCHMNTCPVGVATQKEQLRKKFPGTPEHVANFMLFVAEETRTILAALGYSKLEDVIGRKDLLKPMASNKKSKGIPQPAAVTASSEKSDDQRKLTKTSCVELGAFYDEERKEDDETMKAWIGAARNDVAHSNGPCIEDDMLVDPDIVELIKKNSGVVEKLLATTNTDRSLGGRLAGAIARVHGDYGFEGNLKITCTGAAGQSFGVWNAKGVDLRMIGELNDYVGKGMNGGSIVAVPPPGSNYESQLNVIAGNTCLYGATGGEVYLSGKAGERFGVRNSGCMAVIEGSGDHLGEYMTGGVIVTLGSIGRNVGAGMSGGMLYVYDEKEVGMSKKMHVDNAKNVFRVTTPEGVEQLKGMIEKHHAATESAQAKRILDNWETECGKFWQVASPIMQESAFVGERTAFGGPDFSEETEKTGSVLAAAAVTSVRTPQSDDEKKDGKAK